MKNNKKGFTVVELSLTVVIFSFFMVAVYTIFDTGMKAWNMGRARTDLQNNGEIILKRIIRELSSSSQESIVLDPNGEYISFESPLKNSDFAYDPNNGGTPLWQGNIIYYSSADPVNNNKKILYRRYLSYPGERSLPSPMLDLDLKYKLAGTPPVEPLPDFKPVASGINTFFVSKNKSIINLKIIYSKEAKGANRKKYSVSGTADKGNEIFELQASVVPKN